MPLGERMRRHVGQPRGRTEADSTLAGLDLDTLGDLDEIDRFILREALPRRGKTRTDQ